MDISDVLVLIKAGYTKEDIEKLSSGLSGQTQASLVEADTEDKKQTDLSDQTSPTETNTNLPVTEDKPIIVTSIPSAKAENNSSIEQKLETLINLIQRQAIINSNMPTIPNVTIEDIAAEIIDPNLARRRELDGK